MTCFNDRVFSCRVFFRVTLSRVCWQFKHVRIPTSDVVYVMSLFLATDVPGTQLHPWS
ncbi:hypothetical protein EG68_12370 [Paragonimus skrjabini miyazakii]|uniref:Uncharacterized protein n=1 Tax=Paragonimus skrjabini miyazakii TaxID=59628 RepID=A0A8S9YHK3_9TREM|nr:hypothetical protein EG68_12370 [Paragonimus skrjabini miyazakii]